MCSTTNQPHADRRQSNDGLYKIQISLREQHNFDTMMDSTALIAHVVPESAFPVVSGCVAFGTTLALSTLAQKLVGISTGTKMVPTVAGMATVALASLASQQMAVYNHQYMQSQYYNRPSKGRLSSSAYQRQKPLVATSGRRDYLEVANFKIPLHELRV
jgi:hypothetical protein